MKMKNLTVLLLALIFFGCAAPREVLYDQTKRQPTKSVEVIREGNKPSKPFKEIGELAYEDFGGEEPKVLKKMLKRARLLGGDAILIQPRKDTGYHFNMFGRSGNRFMFKCIAISYQ